MADSLLFWHTDCLRNEAENYYFSPIMTVLNSDELNDAAENYLYDEHADIPAFVITKFIAEAASEYLEDFTIDPQVSPRIKAQIESAIALYRQQENG